MKGSLMSLFPSLILILEISIVEVCGCRALYSWEALFSGLKIKPLHFWLEAVYGVKKCQPHTYQKMLKNCLLHLKGVSSLPFSFPCVCSDTREDKTSGSRRKTDLHTL